MEEAEESVVNMFVVMFFVFERALERFYHDKIPIIKFLSSLSDSIIRKCEAQNCR
jgi:hypothetical protein